MPRCPNGHACDDDARFCDTCGVALALTPTAPLQDSERSQGGLSEFADDAAWPAGATDAPAVPGGRDVPATESPARQLAERPGVQGQVVGRRGGVGSVRGIARGISARSEPWGQGWSRQILSMRVEHYDASGNRLQPVTVELRGWTLSGQISEGEEVDVRREMGDGCCVLRAPRT